MEERLSLLGLSFAEWREERDIWMWREEVSYYWSFRGLPTGKGREGGDQMCESVQGKERKVLPSVKGRKREYGVWIWKSSGEERKSTCQEKQGKSERRCEKGKSSMWEKEAIYLPGNKETKVTESAMQKKAF